MKEEDIKKLNIFEKLSLITDEIGVIEKNLNVQVNKTASYKAVSERDVLDNVKPIERKYRVYSYPINREIIESETLVKESEYNGNITRTNTLFMRLITTYRFVNIDKPEEFIETIVYGDGVDTGDKAPGKAMTYADKYALMKAYKLSTGDDPDKEASPEKGYKKKVAATNKAVPAVASDAINYKALIEKYVLDNKINKLEFCKEHKLNSTSTNEDFKIVYEKVSKEK